METNTGKWKAQLLDSVEPPIWYLYEPNGMYAGRLRRCTGYAVSAILGFLNGTHVATPIEQASSKGIFANTAEVEMFRNAIEIMENGSCLSLCSVLRSVSLGDKKQYNLLRARLCSVFSGSSFVPWEYAPERTKGEALALLKRAAREAGLDC